MIKYFEKILNLFFHKNNVTVNGTYSHSGDLSKIFMSGTEHLTLNTEVEKIKVLVKDAMQDLFVKYKNEPAKMIDFVRDSGTPVLNVDFADKILKIVDESEGFICGLSAFQALVLNLFINKSISFKTQPMFIFRPGVIEPLSLLHNIYRWYSWRSKLPGFDSKSQRLFKRYLKYPNADMSKLSMDDVIRLQEAVARDKEATEFCLYVARETEGAQNVKKKIADGGAEI